MFEKASILKVRFETPKGLIQVEDLWDLDLLPKAGVFGLDNLARNLSKQLKETATESFVVKAPQADEVLQLKFDIVKHIIEVKLAERDKAAVAREAREKKAKILALISQKQDEKLAGASLEELQKLADSL